MGIFCAGLTGRPTRTRNAGLRLRRVCCGPVASNVKPQMKTIHLTALACFGIAMGFYLLAWVPGLFAFALVGVFFEIAAWVKLFSRKEEGRSESS